MTHGTAVVATANPGARFVLGEGRYGVLATATELGERIADLLTDPSTRAKLAREGRERAAEFGWSQVLDRHERAYRGAIGEFNSGRPGAGGSAGTSALGTSALARRASRRRSAGRFRSQ
jgi:hypothetical protein